MLGIDLNDAGFTAVHDDGTSAAIVPLESHRIDLPGWIAWADGGFVLGSAAEAIGRQHPRAATDRAWEDLSHRPGALHAGNRVPPASELAYHILGGLWASLPDSHRGGQALVLALPGHRLRDDPEQQNAVGLVLGIARELGLPLAGIADAALAGVLGHPRLAAAEASAALHLDLTQHAALLTPLRNANGRIAVAAEPDRHPGMGLAALLAEAESRLAALFLARTAFDVGHDIGTELAFRHHLGHLLSHLVEANEGELCAGPPDRPRRLPVDRALLARAVPLAAPRMAEAVARCARHHGLEPTGCPLFLGPQAARIPGLRERLQESGWEVIHLPPGSAARGAARLARTAAVVTDLAYTPTWRELTHPVDALPPLTPDPLSAPNLP